MTRIAPSLLALSLSVLIAVPLMANDRDKPQQKRPRKYDPAAAVLKRLEQAELSEEQVAKVKELVAAAAEKSRQVRAKAALTDEQKLALKKAREEGKRGAELKDVVTLSEAQQAAVKEIGAIRAAMMKQVMGLLTPEQKEKAGIRRAKPPGKKPAPKKKPGSEKKPRPRKPADA
jgi:hypothetical protein